MLTYRRNYLFYEKLPTALILTLVNKDQRSQHAILIKNIAFTAATDLTYCDPSSSLTVKS